MWREHRRRAPPPPVRVGSKLLCANTALPAPPALSRSLRERRHTPARVGVSPNVASAPGVGEHLLRAIPGARRAVVPPSSAEVLPARLPSPIAKSAPLMVQRFSATLPTHPALSILPSIKQMADTIVNIFASY